MKKCNKKRNSLFALLLSLAMILTFIPAVSFAEAGEYHGTQSLQAGEDEIDLSGYEVVIPALIDDWKIYTDQMSGISIEAEVIGGGQVLDKENYDLIIEQESWNEKNEQEFTRVENGALTLSEEGNATFIVYAVAREGSGYTGETTRDKYVDIFNRHSLTGAVASFPGLHLISEDELFTPMFDLYITPGLDPQEPLVKIDDKQLAKDGEYEYYYQEAYIERNGPFKVDGRSFYTYFLRDVEGGKTYADFPTEKGVYILHINGKGEYFAYYDQIGIAVGMTVAELQALSRIPIGKGTSLEAAEALILSMSSESDPEGSTVDPLMLRQSKVKNNSITLAWNAASGAVRYVVYGNRCGSKYKMTKLAEVSGKTLTVNKISGSKLKKGTYHKFIVVAVDKDDKVVSTSKIVHIATAGGKWKNHTKVSVSNASKFKKLKKGKSLKIKAKAVGKNVKKHVGLRYESSNPDIATVSKSGKVKAKAKGSAKITVYAQNGKYKTVSVKVK